VEIFLRNQAPGQKFLPVENLLEERRMEKIVM